MFIKKCFSLMAIVLLTATINVKAVESEMATMITENIKFTINDMGISVLGDNNLSTKHKMSEPQTVNINSEDDIFAMYIIFNKPPEKWEVTYDDKTVIAGENSYMYEVIKLDDGQNNIQINFEKDTEICDIKLYTEGNLPSDVQQWKPPLEDADMLIFPTHADDEHIFFGGIIPYYGGELNKKIQIAYMTNHYGEWYRQHELLGGLWEVGIRNYPIIPDDFIDYPSDSLEHAKTLYNVDDMLAYQVEQIRRFKPEVIIGHDLNGEYGHGVHMLNAHLLTEAIIFSSDATKYNESAEKYGTFDVPKTYLHHYEENKVEIQIDIPLKNFNNRTAFEVSGDGFAYHKSQGPAREEYLKGSFDCQNFGLYRTTVGKDMVGINLFENIKPTPIIEPVLESSNEVSSEIIANVTSEIVSPNNVPSEVVEKEKFGFKNPKSYIFILAGIIVILVTFITQNRRRANKTQAQINAIEAYHKKYNKENFS